MLNQRHVCRQVFSRAFINSLSCLPPVYPEWLGCRGFTATHNTRFAYVVGEMARGIATSSMVISAAKAGLLGFYGSAGLPLDEIRAGIQRIKAGLPSGESTWGANLIHSPQQPEMESSVVDLFLEQGVARVSASAFMDLSPEIVRYSAKGLRQENNVIVRDTHVFAKVSRFEVAEKFMSPAPEAMLRQLVSSNAITAEQAELAAQVPVACDITAESDSGGHTDNRAAAVLLSTLLETAGEIAHQYGFDERSIRIGLAGGIATPQAVAGAFQMGAAYVLTGSINQASVESGLSTAARHMLVEADAADVVMAPAADDWARALNKPGLKPGVTLRAATPLHWRRANAMATFASRYYVVVIFSWLHNGLVMEYKVAHWTIRSGVGLPWAPLIIGPEVAILLL